MAPAGYKPDQHTHLQLSGELEGFSPIPLTPVPLTDPASLLAARRDQHTPAPTLPHVLDRLPYP